MTERPRSGRTAIDWVDATDASPSGDFEWRTAPDPPIDDDRVVALLREISNESWVDLATLTTGGEPGWTLSVG